MNLDTVSLKRCNQLEQQIAELLRTMRSAGLHNYPLYVPLQEFELELVKIRRERFDKNTSEYKGY